MRKKKEKVEDSGLSLFYSVVRLAAEDKNVKKALRATTKAILMTCFVPGYNRTVYVCWARVNCIQTIWDGQ